MDCGRNDVTKSRGNESPRESGPESESGGQTMNAADVPTDVASYGNVQLQPTSPAETSFLASLGALLPRIQQELSPFNAGQNITLANNINVITSGGGDKEQDKIPDILKEKMRNAKEIFQETRGYEYVLGALEDQGYVVIAGSPGSGKTTMSLYLMYKFWKLKYRLKLVRKIRTFNMEKDVDLHHKTLLVFDDVFGYFNTTQEAYLDYKTAFEDIDGHFRYIEKKWSEEQLKCKDNTRQMVHEKDFPLKVIFTTRTNILRDVSPRIKRFQSTLFKPSTVVDLTTLAKLNTDEKKRILMKHLTNYSIHLEDGDVDFIANQEYGCLGFPYICKLFVENKRYQRPAVDFFRQPLAYLSEYITEVFSIDDFRSTAALVLMILLGDGKLDVAAITDESKYQTEEVDSLFSKLKKIIPKLEKESFLPLVKREAFNQLNTLVVSEGDIVKFSHPTIHDAVAFVVGCKDQQFVLTYCTLQFIIERVKVATKSDEQPSSGNDYDFTITLHYQSVSALIERLAREIIAGNVALALSHYCLRETQNAERLYAEIVSKGNVKVIHTIEGSHNFCFLFWVAFTCNSALCRLVLADELFEHCEIFQALLGYSLSGDLEGMTILLEHCKSTPDLIEKIKSISMEDILHGHRFSSDIFDKIATVYTGIPKRDQGKQEKVILRSDKLIHIATANGYCDIVTALLQIGINVDSVGGSGFTPLMYACYHGYKKLAQVLFEKGACLELRMQGQDANCLHLASMRGFTDISEWLLESGIDMERRDIFGRTPLMLASQYGNLDTVKFLLRKGAQPEPDISDVENKDHCLHLAAGAGRTEIVKVLIEQGRMNIDVLGVRNRTAFMFACRHGHLQIAKYLAEKGTNFYVLDVEQFNCLHVAAIGGNNEIVTWLLDSLQKNSLNEYKRTPLMYAFLHGHGDTVQLLLDVGADASLKDYNGNNCIHFAARAGDESLVETCLERGQRVNCRNDNGVTPLMNVCGNGNVAMLTFLLNKQADYSLKTTSGDTCFHFACRYGSTDAVKYLHSHYNDIDINQPGYRQRTPLFQACLSGHSDVVGYLLNESANHELTDDQGLSCSHAACQSGDLGTLLELSEHKVLNFRSVDKFGNSPFLTAVKSDETEMIRFLLLLIPSLLENRNNRGENALHVACRAGILSTAKILIQSGMDINSPDKDGMTPLMAAVCSRDKNDDVVMLLLNNNADVKLLNNSGAAALHFACMEQSDDIKIVSSLLQADPSGINQTDIHGKTPLIFAAKRWNDKVAELLISKGADVTLKDIHGLSCCDYAALSGNHELESRLQMLVQRN